MEALTVYLVRHGKVRWQDDQRRYIGQLDPPLEPEGVRQAELLQRRLQRVEAAAVYCSDLLRSRQTAAIIAGDRLTVTALRGLREIALGDWEGCTFADIARRYPNEFKARGADIAYYRVSGGESFADCSRRVVAAFQAILAAATGDIIIVGHAGVNRVLLCHCLGLPLANLFRLGQDYGCLNVIHCGGPGYQLKLVNG